MKKIKAVRPYIYEGKINFKHKAYDAWKYNLSTFSDEGEHIARSHYPWRCLHSLIFKYDFPTFGWIKTHMHKNEARLRFVQPWSLSFDAWPDYMFYEVIPFFWDVWPDNFERTCEWLRKYEVKTAIFTSSQISEKIKMRFPEMNVMWCPEGIDVDGYKEGRELKNRKIDFFEYGRSISSIVTYTFDASQNVIRGQKNGENTLSNDEFFSYLQDSKVVPCFTKNLTDPNLGGGIETLTQRYWECMLSRVIMLGHAPKELIDFIGYNPVIDIDLKCPNDQLYNILKNISDYQPLVNKNREISLRIGDWKIRMKEVVKFLNECVYEF